jgi:hypothetical protein
LLNSFSRSALVFCGLLATAPLFAAGSAIITLEMPVGARQLGMGESGVALGDDANTLYYNPAGLAFGPISNEWELTRTSPAPGSRHFTALAARTRKGFLSRSEVWAGSATGLLHFNGEEWLDYQAVLLEGSAKVRDVVRTFIGGEESLDSLAGVVRRYNKVETVADEEFLVQVNIPFSLVVHDTVTALLYEDRTEKLWVGTTKGLYRYDGRTWKFYAQEFGTPRITALTNQGATLWIGTDNGLFTYRNGAFEQKGKVLPSQNISALAWSEMRKELYVGVQGAGVARLVPKVDEKGKDRWNLFTLDDGLLDLSPTALVVDSSGHVWSAHAEGLTHFNLRKWEQVRFDKNRVHSIAVSEKGAIWIGTDKGVWSHLPDYATAKGRKGELENATRDSVSGSGTWNHYHSGNGLHSNNVYLLLPQENDLWFSSGAGIERFHSADNQVAFFYEKLLPVLNIPDLYHLYTGITFPAAEWGTLGVFVNFISFGQTVVTTETDADNTSTFNSSETVVGLSYGTRLNRNWGLGLNFKFFYSRLSSGAAVGEPDATTASYAVDAGLLGKDLGIKGLNAGLVLANIGPNVYYVDKSNDDPIPLTWRFGLSYDLIRSVDHRLVVTADYNRTVIYEDGKGKAQPFYISAWKAWFNPETGKDDDGSYDTARKSIQEGQLNTGVEYTYANTVALRAGYLHDKTGQRQEVDFGLGVMLSDMLQLDIASIQGVGDVDGVRDGQMRFGMLFKF